MTLQAIQLAINEITKAVLLLEIAVASFLNPAFGGIGAPPETFGASKTALEQSYNLNTEIKAKYTLDGASLKKNNGKPKDRIDVIIGDKNKNDFEPTVEIQRWDNEVSFKIKAKSVDKIDKKDKTLKLEGDKVKLETPDIDYLMYEMPVSEENPEGAFEYEIVLNKAPPTNVIEFTLETKGLSFYYQPELTQEEIDRGDIRPENVVGSYAVYATEQKTNWVGGKEYKTGKVGHIYRPKITDSAGTEVWGDLHIENGILSVTIPQEFLDKAVYPVRHAAGLTFGFTGAGAGGANFVVRELTVYTSSRIGMPSTPASAGTLDKITAGFASVYGSRNIDFTAYVNQENTGTNSHTEIAKKETLDLAITTTRTWYDFALNNESITAISYILNILGNASDIGVNYEYVQIGQDATSRPLRYFESWTGAGGYASGKEGPWTNVGSANSYLLTIYATYTADAPPAEAPPRRRIIITE